MRVVNILYIEIIIQVVFRIWFFITDLHWEGDNILAWVDFIQLRINLQYILKPSPLQSKWIISTYRKKQNKISYLTEKCENILSDLDFKTCFHILFEVLSSYLRSYCKDLRYWIYIYSVNWENPSMTFSFHWSWAWFVI